MVQYKNVLDLTGGAGSESIYFANNKNIIKVVSYELDKKRHDLFNDNI